MLASVELQMMVVLKHKIYIDDVCLIMEAYIQL